MRDRMVEREPDRMPQRETRMAPRVAPDDVGRPDGPRPFDMREPRADMDAIGRDAQVGRLDTRELVRERAELERPHTAERTRAFVDIETEDEVRARLRAQGMRNVRDIERHNEHEYFAAAEWFGEEVEARIDIRTGEILEPERLSEGQIRYKLEQEGWEDIRDVERGEDVVEVVADYNDESFQLRLDPQSGRLLQWRDAG
jgi:hypothetical protein